MRSLRRAGRVDAGVMGGRKRVRQLSADTNLRKRVCREREDTEEETDIESGDDMVSEPEDAVEDEWNDLLVEETRITCCSSCYRKEELFCVPQML